MLLINVDSTICTFASKSFNFKVYWIPILNVLYNTNAQIIRICDMAVTSHSMSINAYSTVSKSWIKHIAELYSAENKWGIYCIWIGTVQRLHLEKIGTSCHSNSEESMAYLIGKTSHVLDQGSAKMLFHCSNSVIELQWLTHASSSRGCQYFMITEIYTIFNWH